MLPSSVEIVCELEDDRSRRDVRLLLSSDKRLVWHFVNLENLGSEFCNNQRTLTSESRKIDQYFKFYR